MNQEYENYFIKRYVDPLEVPNQFTFILDENIENIITKDMVVIPEGCISLLILDLDDLFYLYYPYANIGKLQRIKLPDGEDPLVYNSMYSGKKQFAYTHQTLALIYDDKVIKLFQPHRDVMEKIIDFESQPKKIVAKNGNFYILLDTDKVVVIDMDGEIVVDDNDDYDQMFDHKESRLTYDIDIRTLEVDCSENLWALSDADQQLYHFIKTPYYEPAKIFEQSFDSFRDSTMWSNLYIDGEFPDGTIVEIEVKAVDGISQKFTNMSNILLYDFQGRQLEVKVVLHSDAMHTLTPTIHSIRVTFDQKPYIDYLPSYYQQDKEVLSRYLSIFQNIMGELEADIDKRSEMLDPLLCDSEYLEWLSSLVGIARDYRWEEEKWRHFLARASHLYRGLGTKKAMIEAIYLYCGEEPKIDDLEEPFEFCVRLSGDKTESKRDVEVIESIIQAFKPAYTSGRLYIDHGLSEKKEFIVGESVLSYNTEIR